MTQLEPFPTGLRLTRIDPAQNMRRFYRLALQPDLFGGCTLIREWGRIGRGGRIKREECASEGRERKSRPWPFHPAVRVACPAAPS